MQLSTLRLSLVRGNRKYSIYISKTGETPRRIATDVPEKHLDERVSRVQNCWPQHTVAVMHIVENLSLIYAPKCVGDEDCEVNCSDRAGTQTDNGRIDTPGTSNSCV